MGVHLRNAIDLGEMIEPKSRGRTYVSLPGLGEVWLFQAGGNIPVPQPDHSTSPHAGVSRPQPVTPRPAGDHPINLCFPFRLLLTQLPLLALNPWEMPSNPRLRCARLLPFQAAYHKFRGFPLKTRSSLRVCEAGSGPGP